MPLEFPVSTFNTSSIPLPSGSSVVGYDNGNLIYQNGVSWANINTFSGSLTVSGSLSGSIKTTAAGNNFLTASGIEVNYNSLGQWEITGSKVDLSWVDTSINNIVKITGSLAALYLSSSSGLEVTGSLVSNQITGSIQKTVAGNDFLTASTGITVNYNNLGQWEITSSGQAQISGLGISGSVITTDATPTLILSHSLTTGSVSSVNFLILADKDTNSERASFTRTVLAYRSGSGNAAIQGDVQVSLPDTYSTGASTWSVNIDTSGSDVRLFVTGAVGNTILWSAKGDFGEVSSLVSYISASLTASYALPGGLDTYVQFNDSNVLNGVAGFTFQKTSNILTVGSGSVGSIILTGSMAISQEISASNISASNAIIQTLSSSINKTANDLPFLVNGGNMAGINYNAAGQWEITGALGQLQWVEGTPSPRIRTTASVAIGSGSNFAQDWDANATFVVSGSRTTSITTFSPTNPHALFTGDVVNNGTVWFDPENNVGSNIRFLINPYNSSEAPLLESYYAGNRFGVISNQGYQLIFGPSNWASGYRTAAIYRGPGTAGDAVLQLYDPSISFPKSQVVARGDLNSGANTEAGYGYGDVTANSQSGIAFDTYSYSSYWGNSRLWQRLYVGPKTDGVELVGGVCWQDDGNEEFIIRTPDRNGSNSNPTPTLTIRPGRGYGTAINKFVFGGTRRNNSSSLQSYIDVVWVMDWGLRLIPQTTSSIPALGTTELSGSLIYSSEDNKLKFADTSNQVKEVYVSAIQVFSSSVSSSNGTPILLQSILLTSGSTYNIDSTVIAKQDTNTNRGRWVKNLLVFNTGSVGIEGNTVYDVVPSIVSSGSWNMNYETSGSYLKIYVTGSAATNVLWSVNTELTAL